MPYISEKEYRDLRLAGEKLSNMAFNLQYRGELDSHIRNSCIAGFEEWDQAKTAVTKGIAKRKAKPKKEVQPNGTQEAVFAVSFPKDFRASQAA